MDNPQIITHIQKSVDFTLFDVRWIPSSAKFALLGTLPRGTGSISIYELDKTEVKLVKQIEKSKAFKCGTFGGSRLENRYLSTGDFGGNLHVWNLEQPADPVYQVKGHKEIINCVDGVIGHGAPEIVTGSRDGSVKVWDPRQKDEPVACMEPAEGEPRRDCWTVAFGNSFNSEERVVCAGYDNGDIKLFDLKKMCLRWETNIRNGVCCVQFDRNDIEMNKLVVTSLESKFYVYDVRTLHPDNGFASLSQSAHKSTIWCVRHLPQNRDIFMTTGGSGTVHLWKYNYPSQRTSKDKKGIEEGVIGSLTELNHATLGTQPVSGFDWHPDMQGLAVCTSFDQTVRVVIVTKLSTL